MTTNITLSNGQKIWLNVVCGEVLDTSESSVATVHQGRDRPQVMGGTTVFLPGRIHSEIVTTHKVWIRNAEGKDSEHDVSDFFVASRKGHQIALVYGAAEGVNMGEFFGALNISTEKFAFDESIHCDRLRPFNLYIPPKFFRKTLMWGAGIGACIGAVSWMLATRGDFTLVTGGAIVGLILSLPICLVQACRKQWQGQRMVPEINRSALELLKRL